MEEVGGSSPSVPTRIFMTFEFPTHIILHPHATVADYAEVKDLARLEEDPFLFFLPEVPQGTNLVGQLQKVSDGDKALYRQFQRLDKSNQRGGFSLNPDLARGRALAETVFNTGLIVVSTHPKWDERTMLANKSALGTDRQFRPTLGEAVTALEDELPKIAEIVKRRDRYTATNYTRLLTEAADNFTELKMLDVIPCLMEIGSLHFLLADCLREKGIEVTTSGDDTVDAMPGSFENGVATLLTGGSLSDLDLEYIALEDLLSRFVIGESTEYKISAIRRLIDSQNRKDWANYYKSIFASS